METIAVYWEARVKVYGIVEKLGLAMGILDFPADRLGFWSEKIMELGDCLSRFELVTCHGTDKEKMQVFLLVEASERKTLTNLMGRWLDGETPAQFTMEEPVDMIFLHGPHFQDRFGIAEIAFAALAKNCIPLLLSGCAGTSMYLVVAEGKGGAATKTLTDTFLIPTIA